MPSRSVKLNTRELNESQINAVTHNNGPLLILAGAGSGKTRIITHRIAWLIERQNIPPARIFAVTFTNKAANEMKARIGNILETPVQGLWIGTFHSLCLRILKMEVEGLEGYTRGFTIYDTADQTRLIKDCLRQLDMSEKHYEPKKMRALIDALKNRGEQLSEPVTRIHDSRIRGLLTLYEKTIVRNNAMDFSDLLALTLRLFKQKREVAEKYQNKFEHVLVDEYQDTNHLQYGIVRILAGKKKNIFVVGDDNQSIYSWRGADISNILNFEKDFPDTKTIKLEKNYRSTRNIIDLSNHLIKHNTERKEKTLWTDNSSGEPVEYFECSDERKEASRIADHIRKIKDCGESYGNIAVFYRTNNQSKAIENELILSAIPYSIVGGAGFYQRTEIKDIIAYLKVLINRADDISLKRILNVPPRGIGKVTQDRLWEIAREKGTSLFETIESACMDGIFTKNITVKLMRLTDLLRSLKENSPKMQVSEIIQKIIDSTGYLSMIENEEERIGNLSELVNLGAEFDASGDEQTDLASFLDWISLVSDIDSFSETKESVTLMTLHTAKGLEFPYVFIAGLEEGLIPHFRSLSEPRQVEEERRLLYVGITRAKRKVFLSSASKRRYFGKDQSSLPSRFLEEFPQELINRHGYPFTFAGQDYGITETKGKAGDNHAQGRSGGSEDKHRPSLFKGKHIEHPKFGRGVVLNIEGKGANAKITVLFGNHGKKRILASFLS